MAAIFLSLENRLLKRSDFDRLEFELPLYIEASAYGSHWKTEHETTNSNHKHLDDRGLTLQFRRIATQRSNA